MKKAIVVGLGISGKSAVRLLLSKGFRVIGVDKNRTAFEGLSGLARISHKILDEDGQDVATDCSDSPRVCEKYGLELYRDSEQIDLNGVSLAVLSPGISPLHPLCCQIRNAGIELIGEIELAAREIHQKCIGITGTNGKTTVTLLIEHVLRSLGLSVKAVGNVGVPLSDEVLQTKESVTKLHGSKDQILVIELSSFQLETLKTPILDAAVILNITFDHMDRYPSMNEYVQAKMQIKDCLKPGGMIYIESRTLKEYGHLLMGRMLQRYQGDTFEMENENAAFEICSSFGVTKKQFEQAVSTFKKPPHRLEYVCNLEGVSYYNDSKGTNLDAVIRAVEKMPGRVILIAGGISKGADFKLWVEPFGNKVIKIFAIGEAKESIHKELSSHIPVKVCKDLDQAVESAMGFAKPGDTVLLSPGCSSYDMFLNYKERGERFKSILQKRKP